MRRWFQRARPPATPERVLPEGYRVYAVGDIHGCRDELDQLLDAIVGDLEGYDGTSCLVFLGDYIDRGPASAAVIDRLIDRDRLPGSSQVFLAGNHELVFQSLLAGEGDHQKGWLTYGGWATLKSYGVGRAALFAAGSSVPAVLRERVPEAHQRFIAELEMSARIGDYLFVHAGVRPGVALEAQAPRDLAWIRDEFLGSTDDHGAMIVHGHTIAHQPDERPNRIGIDTGCYKTGVLTALVLEGTTRRFLTSGPRNADA